MGKLRDHFDPGRDPEGYELVKCEVCNGSGLPKVSRGEPHTT